MSQGDARDPTRSPALYAAIAEALFRAGAMLDTAPVATDTPPFPAPVPL